MRLLHVLFICSDALLHRGLQASEKCRNPGQFCHEWRCDEIAGCDDDGTMTIHFTINEDKRFLKQIHYQVYVRKYLQKLMKDLEEKKSFDSSFLFD